MPAITGISEGTKEILLNFLNRQRPRMTQRAWVEKNLDRDLKEEKEREQNGYRENSGRSQGMA